MAHAFNAVHRHLVALHAASDVQDLELQATAPAVRFALAACQDARAPRLAALLSQMRAAPLRAGDSLEAASILRDVAGDRAASAHFWGETVAEREAALLAGLTELSDLLGAAERVRAAAPQSGGDGRLASLLRVWQQCGAVEEAARERGSAEGSAVEASAILQACQRFVSFALDEAMRRNHEMTDLAQVRAVSTTVLRSALLP